MNQRQKFYQETVSALIPDRDCKILVCGGGRLDREVFQELGFTNVTISNLDERYIAEEYLPFAWSFQNAENLTFADLEFDFIVIHAAIHHCPSPHRVLTEMYRVCKQGFIAFESRDSLVMRLLEKLSLTQTYEHAAVYYNDCKYGGVNNTEIPNYIYRWTEREIEKTINAYAPYGKHELIYKYGSDFPCTPSLERKGQLKYIALKILQPAYNLFTTLFPKQQNLFAFYLKKQDLSSSIFPWLIIQDGQVKFNKEWGERKYNKNLA